MNWQPVLIWLHVISDGLIVLAYASIPILLLTFVRKRRDISFSWMLLAFGAFILACGATHFMSIVTLWKPWYFAEGILKLATAVASVVTALLLRRLLPVLLKIPSTSALEQANQALESSNKELERRTVELAASYAALQATSDAYRQSEEQFRQLANSMPQIVWTAAPDGRVDYFNDRWYAFTGLDKNLFDEQSWLPLLHPEDRRKPYSAWHSCVGSGSPYKEEFRFWDRASGTYRWHMSQALPIANEAGTIVKWYGACTDIDDYKRAQIEVLNLNSQLETRVAERTQELTQTNFELRKAQTWLQAILHSATEVSIMVLDNRGIITFFNSGAERLLGYKAEELIGKSTPHILYPPEQRELRARQLSAELKRPANEEEIFLANQPSTSFVTESVYLHRDGTRIDVSLAISPMIDSDGERLGKLAIAVDMRPRKALEKQLTENNLRLVEQTQHAENANRAKSQFLSAMSHEIRTPMNAILGMADLLWETDLNETQRKYVAVFRRACGTLLSLVNDILDLSKIESGRFDLERIDFDLNDVVQLTLDMVTPKAEAKGLTVKSSIAPDTPCLLAGDPTRLQQILSNLLGNAVKFTESGSIELSIGPASDQTGRLHFEVTDTGVGIPSDKLESVFEDFTQAESSTTRRFGGTGLGLGICRRLINRMGGQLNVRSELGKGSCFFFDAVFGLASKEARPRLAPMNVLSGQRVLILDDNKVNRLIFAEICNGAGMVTTEFDDVHAGLAVLEASAAKPDFDLVILDRMIREADGIEVVRKIRELHRCLPILLITSDKIPGDQTKVLNWSATEYAVKPVLRAELLRLMAKLLAGSKPLPETPHHEAQANASTPHRRILVADDSEDNQFLLQEYLKGEPYDITFVANGDQAVKAAQTQPFDLILMDTEMPEMDGLTATKMIRAAEKTTGRARVPLLALTANAGPGDSQVSRDAGSDAHISKPISKEELIKALRHFTLSAPLEKTAAIVLNIPPGSEEAAKRYLRSRKEEIPILLESLRARDLARIRVLAHAIADSGLSSGFARLTELGKDMETAAEEGQSALLSQQLTELTAYVRQAEQAFLSSQPAAGAPVS